MNAYVTGFARNAPVFPVADRALAYAMEHQFDRPTLVLDIEAVGAAYRALKEGFGRANLHYAVKANPERAVLSRLRDEGGRFDAASRGEIELCLSLGIRADHISFGNTVKTTRDIAFAFAAGIRFFAADSEEELAKIAAHAPGAHVYIRYLVEHSMADWPLSRKFGVNGERVLELLDLARDLDLVAAGISFHVGSQTRNPEMWLPTLDSVADIWKAAHARGHVLTLLNLGGGFPAFYGEEVTAKTAYAAAIMGYVTTRFGNVPYIMAEPGRGMVAEAGVIAADVVLTTRKTSSDLHRWVFLSIGKFSGLAETMDEAIRYQFVTDHDGGEMGPCVLAGPSCDSADILYEKRPIELPLALKSGDRIVIRACGAYTTTYASIGFNGFPPLDVVCI